MAKIIIAGDALVIESAHTLEEIKILETYRPKALMLYDEDGEDAIFLVGTTTGKGSITRYGASFGSASRNGSGNATITTEIPADVTDATKYAEEKIGISIIHLNAVEAQFASALEAIEAEKETIRSNINVI